MVVYYKTIKFSFCRVGIVWVGEGDNIVIKQILLARFNVKKIIKSFYPEAVSGRNQRLREVAENLLNHKWQNIPLKLLAFSQLTRFSRRVLSTVRRIPRGRVITYKRLANRVGVKGGARAVGQSLAKNPFPLVIPCHRVIKSDRSLGGFSGGIKLKRLLLEAEGIKFSQNDKVLSRIS